MRSSALTALTLFATFSLTAAAAADKPATRPTIPPLIVGAPPPNAFVVQGICRTTAEGGFAFHVATDGKRQVCALYDPADGTPLFLSDGQQTLVYDLVNSRVVRVPISRGNVRVDWDPKDERPLDFSLGVSSKSKPEKLDEANAWFRIDRFAESARTLKHLGREGNFEQFAAERIGGGGVESLQVERGNDKWFRFTSRSRGESFYRLELTARIGDPLPENALAFPDVSRLPDDVHLHDLERTPLPTFLVYLRDGRAWLAKMALAAGPEMREDAKKVIPGADWDALRERDAHFGAAYRKALAEQGVAFPTYSSAAATQPTQ